MKEKKNDESPEIILRYPTNFPSKGIIYDMDETQNLNIKVIKDEQQVFCANEWIIPTVFGLYILKPYFNAFLSEAGKDHYQSLKRLLQKLLQKGKIFTGKLVASQLSPDKIAKKYNQSILISVELQTVDNKICKLLFNDQLDTDDWSDASERLLNLLIDNYTNYPNDWLTLEISKLKHSGYEGIYLIIDEETNELLVMDDRKMTERFRK